MRFGVISTVVLAGVFPLPALATPEALSPSEARHLVARTGFGASPDEITAVTGLSRMEAVAQIMAGLTDDPVYPMPVWTQRWTYPMDQVWVLSQTEEEFFYNARWYEIAELQQWWLAEMIATPDPLSERMVLFWHDHFATSFDGIQQSQWIATQNAFFRAHATGNFADLAHGILRDPAMLEYLTNTTNVRDAPNENLGREFLELFTLGEGRGYTEGDIVEAARALTGATIAEYGAPVYAFEAEVHDAGDKTILGETGPFDAIDLAEIVLSHPEFGPYIVEKLWLTFVSDQPDPAEVDRLVALWRARDLEMEPLLEALFLTDAFWDPANRGRLIKSPVELVVGTVRSLGLPVENVADLLWAMEDLGQMPFFPPNVGGWAGGTFWINDATASARATVLTDMLYFDGDVGIAAGSDAMMMQPQVQTSVAVAEPGDLRVGEIFVTYAEPYPEQGSVGASIVLYDVGFAGFEWRSLTLWVDAGEGGDWPYIGVHTADCRPECFATWALDDDDPGWVGYSPYEGPPASEADLLTALLTHLPALVADTEDQSLWTAEWAREDGWATFAETRDAIDVLSAAGADTLGISSGDLIRASTPRGNFGLGAVSFEAMGGIEALGEDGVNQILEGYEAAVQRSALPPAVYASARDWMNALPAGATDSQRAELALLAIPLPLSGRRDEMVVSDPEALIRRIVLSPYFQLN